MVQNQNACDFRVSEYNSSYTLSSIFLSSGDGGERTRDHDGLVLYRCQQHIRSQVDQEFQYARIQADTRRKVRFAYSWPAGVR